MKLSKINRLINMLPDGEKKNKFMEKLSKISNSQPKNDGLHDKFSLGASGHICIEEIDSSGEVVGTLADQQNLVVDGSEEILLRAFSGDPERVLYKNRVLRNGESKIYHAELDRIVGVEGGQNIVLSHPNDLWKLVDEEEFEHEYSYYPNTLYVQEVESLEPGKKGFVIKSVPGTDTAPLTSEIYSTFTNLFIGIGEGESYSLDLNDSRLNFSDTFVGDDKKESSSVNDEVTFKEKISRFTIQYHEKNSGGNLEIYIDDELKETINTRNSDLNSSQVLDKEITFDGLDHLRESSVRVKFSGSDEEVSNPTVTITGIKIDSFEKGMSNLIGEFKNYRKDFDTIEFYNTTSVTPYQVTLDFSPVLKGSVVVSYNDVEFEEVESIEDLKEESFYVDDLEGILYFNNALTNLSVKYEVTGQTRKTARVVNLDTRDITLSVSDETPEGDVDGENTIFKLQHSNLISYKVTKNGEEMEEGSQSSRYSMNSGTGVITFRTAPEEDDEILVDYTFRKEVNVLKTDYPVDEDQEIIFLNQFNEALEKTTSLNELRNDGVFLVDRSDSARKVVLFTKINKQETPITSVKMYHYSEDLPGVPTGYKRKVVEKPKTVNDYPWYALDKGSIHFVAEFPEGSFNHSVTIREMGLFDGPRVDDQVKGFKNYPVKAFSLVRVGEARKDKNTGIRVTWTITLTDEDGNPFTEK